jgi:imidazoleglycerol phosphate synthase glutamine amidotransferase subunit HisH
VPAAAAVDEGCTALLEVTVGVAEAAEEEAEEEAMKPLQKPPLQVLKAHCESLLQEAWKLPQIGWSIEFTA